MSTLIEQPWLRQVLITAAIGVAISWATFIYTTLSNLTQDVLILQERLAHTKSDVDEDTQTLATNIDINRDRIRTIERELVIHQNKDSGVHQ